MADATGRRVLMLAMSGYEDTELWGPREALLRSGGSGADPRCGFDDATQSGGVSDRDINPDLTLEQVDVDDYHALLLPGGLQNSGRMRGEQRVLEIVRAFMSAGKPVAAICHAPWLLAAADVLGGRRVTAWRDIRDDIAAAGAEVIDAEVVVDGNVITSRMPVDVARLQRGTDRCSGADLGVHGFEVLGEPPGHRGHPGVAAALTHHLESHGEPGHGHQRHAYHGGTQQ
jgi:protease I